ncbi:hypothetical protein GO298_02583 [Ralstonia solanacearum]|nr:hypothetical protein [Ralstonia solanacearum]
MVAANALTQLGTDGRATVDENIEGTRYQASSDVSRCPGHRAEHFAKTTTGRGASYCGRHQGQRRAACHDHSCRAEERAGNQTRNHPALRRGMCNRVAKPCSR